MENKKIMLVCVTSLNVLTFRMGLIESLQEKGYEVHVICFDEKYKKEIEDKGIVFHSTAGNNRGTGILENLKLSGKYKKIIKEISPSIVFTFMLKPNVFGVKAAKKSGVKNIYSMVEGLGDVYINNSFKWKVIRRIVSFLYKKSFKISKKIFFLNNDDRDLFIKNKLVHPSKVVLINGIGVDSEKYAQAPLSNNEEKIFLMVARLNRTKGVYEYCDAARRIRRDDKNSKFWLLGQEGNISLEDLKEYIDDGSVEYKGTTDNIYEYYKKCYAYVLPSYREGMSMSILEAMSTGRAIITTNTEGGCRYIVEDGINGYLVNVKDSSDLANKIQKLAEDKSLCEKMAKASRNLVETKYSKDIINKKVCFEILGE